MARSPLRLKSYMVTVASIIALAYVATQLYRFVSEMELHSQCSMLRGLGGLQTLRAALLVYLWMRGQWLRMCFSEQEVPCQLVHRRKRGESGMGPVEARRDMVSQAKDKGLEWG